MRSNRTALVLLLAAAPLTSPDFVRAQVGPTTIEDAQGKTYEESVHWARRQSLTLLVTQNTHPIVKQVVLVPNAATFIDELSRWSTEAKWPILFEDDFYAPMFIRAYRPDAVFRRASVGTLPEDMTARRTLIDRTVANSWRVEKTFGVSYADVMGDRGFKPMGAVVTSLKDPAWVGGIALAAARGLDIFYIDEDLGQPGDILSDARTRELMDRIERMVRRSGTEYTEVGDRFDFLTVCRTMAARTNVDIGGALPDRLPPAIRNGPKAITDVIGRHLDGRRWAFTGWILGSQRSSLYAAMCSFFLPRTTVWLGDSYQHEEGRDAYQMGRTAIMYEQHDYEVELHENLTRSSFQAATSTGIDADQIYMNSSGNADFFDLGPDRCSPYDVPVLDRPAFLYLIHSWSMKTPDDPNTIGGRWMRNGAYAAYASSHEPLLSAFRPAYEVARRIISLIPLGPSVRLWEGEAPLSVAWRVNLFGDPMMLSGGAKDAGRPLAPIDGGSAENLNEAARKAMERALDAPSDDAFAETIRLFILINLDGLARDLWARAVKDGAGGPETARVALPPLFRGGDRTAFLEAWSVCFADRDAVRPNQRELDMLWSLVGPTLAQEVDPETIELMTNAIRRRYPSGDMQRLAPALDRTGGRQAVRTTLRRIRQTAANQREKKAIDQLLEQYD